jgi:hypothetical protein
MGRQEFLHRSAETPLNEHFISAGAVCSLATNSERLLENARRTFQPIPAPSGPLDFSMRLWVEGDGAAQQTWPKPYVRGLDHLVFAGFDARSSLLADLRTRRVIGRFSRAMASDTGYWKTIIFPMLLSIMAGSVGLVELHASCVARDGLGLILAGPSQSGKSTLAMALHEAGFALLSDDRTFCSVRNGKLSAWGLPRPLKLRREAASWFDEFRDREPTDVQNGERVFHFEPKQGHGFPCEPRLLVFLERTQKHGFSMMPMNRLSARPPIENDLLAEVPEAMRKQSEPLQALLSLPCFTLRYGGQPQEIARQLSEFFVKENKFHASSGAQWKAS